MGNAFCIVNNRYMGGVTAAPHDADPLQFLRNESWSHNSFVPTFMSDGRMRAEAMEVDRELAASDSEGARPRGPGRGASVQRVHPGHGPGAGTGGGAGTGV